MKKFLIKVTVAVFTFIIGIVFVSFWLVNPKPLVSETNSVDFKVKPMVLLVPEVTPDLTIYSINFCELVQNSKQYHGKIIRTQAFYLQGIDFSSLSDSKCQGWISPSCNNKDAPCEKILRNNKFGNSKVDVIGRFKTDVIDQNSFPNSYHVNLLEILELKSIKPVKKRK